jgi:hypothetical protein
MLIPFFFLLLIKLIFYRAETPPNTPRRARIAAQQLERSNRTLDSPQRHRTPHQAILPPIPPLQFNGPPPPPPLIIPGDDPFALPPPVHFNGHQFNNLPQHLAQQVRNLPALPQRGRGRGHVPPVRFLNLILIIYSNILNSLLIYLTSLKISLGILQRCHRYSLFRDKDKFLYLLRYVFLGHN